MNYQQATMLLAKCGLSATQVWQMSHLEVQCWIEVYLQQLGIKETVPSTVIVSRRVRSAKTE